MRPSLPRNVRRLSATLMAAALLAGNIQTATAADPTHRFDPSQLRQSKVRPVQVGGTITGDFTKTKDGKVAVIVKLSGESIASYKGGVNGLRATNPASRGLKTIDLKGTDTTRYRSFLKIKQDAFTRQLTDKVKGAKVTGHFDVVLNAVSAIIPADKVTAVAKLPGVAAVYADELRHPLTDASPAFIGAPTMWSNLGGQENAGEGVIVGVLDTGIWPEHPSFSDPDPSGKRYPAPTPPPVGTRACEFGSATPGDVPFTCNNKLIGAERFLDTYDAVIGLLPTEFVSARDDNGHGTHTSSTAAGNAKVAASIFGVSRGIVSGIAPRAHVEMFKVLGQQGGFDSDIVAGIQAAIQDGVNVINFSISGGSDPYNDPAELAFLDAYDAGVFVAAAAGNSGPTPDTTDHRGPWVTTVAASSGPRAFLNTIRVTATGGATLDLPGVSLTAGVGPKTLVVNPDTLCLNPAAAGAFTDKIVICKRGNPVGRVDDGFNVLQGGAAGFILYNQSPAVTDQETDNHFLPASQIQNSQGLALLAFLAAHTGVVATITAGAKGTQQADVMASFSSRGGPGQTLGISKPDITAPGVQILAGNSPMHVPAPEGVAEGPEGELFQAIAGTSMSSPHIAGSGALLKAQHPTWSPGQIKSAIMTTAKTNVKKENGTSLANAFDDGSGRVNLNKAGNPGLTFDATGTEYLAWQDELFRVNYPSIYHPTMPGVVTVTRTAHSVLPTASRWRLKGASRSDFRISVPRTISVAAGADATFNVKMDASLVPLGQTRFGMITLTQIGGSHRVLHMPVTIVRGQEDVTLTKSCAPTVLARHARTSCTITATNPTSKNVTYSISDRIPANRLSLIRSSVRGASIGRGPVLRAHGTLLAAQPADVNAAKCATATPCSPFGYVPLTANGFGIDVGAGDETIANIGGFGTFLFAGESWGRIGFVSDGYAVVGGGTGADIDAFNQILPDSAIPNNVLAPFWTDLDPEAGGKLLFDVLVDRITGDAWLVLGWEAVQESSTTPPATDSFQIWIGLNGVEDITYTYGPMSGGNDGFATAGAENKFGNRGATVYADGTIGTIPVADTEIQVTSTPGFLQSKVITFNARSNHRGNWRNCAALTSNAFLGTSVSCVRGRNLR